MKKRLIQIGAIAAILVVTLTLIAVRFPRTWGDIFYPLDYKNDIVKNAAEFSLERNFVAAVIYKESRFNPRAVSSAGARGLMQLLPSTAQAQAARLGVQNFTVEQLYDPAINIRLGTAYLRSQLDFCGGSKEAALAAYNAGCTRGREYARTGSRDILPRETQGYVRGVLSAQTVYDQLYGADWEGGTRLFNVPKNDGGAFWKTFTPANLFKVLFKQ